MANKKTSSGTNVAPIKQPRSEAITFKVRIEPSDGDAVYANYMEVSHSQYEFMLTVAQVPSKLTSAATAQAQELGEIVIESKVQILFPPRLMGSLLKVLETERDKYETDFGKITTKEKDKIV